MRLIDANELKKVFDETVCIEPLPYAFVKQIIDNAPTVELDEDIIQRVLNKRCMTAVANEYLIALHNNRPTGEWIEHDFKTCGGLGDWDYKCSNCEKVYCGKSNYCPNCGARMKGEEE